jgi:hypothetical protein
MSAPSREATHGEEGLPVGAPEKNQGAAAAIDPHQIAAAAVMIGIDRATAMASDPATLS